MSQTVTEPLKILKEYWGYDAFRGEQESIIQSILQRQDTLALLPTGGGKSICYQVPGMIFGGLTLVISPLIALMQDQVDQLRNRGIKADLIHGQLTKQDIDRILDNCIYGDYRFLMISPERVQNELFRQRLVKMNVQLIAIDEAHCISEWGYDFRPSYLKLSELRELCPDTPILALTASATVQVKEDIQDKLGFTPHNAIAGDFSRNNLSYGVEEVADKKLRILELLNAYAGSAIIYVNRRRHVKDLAEYLIHQGYSAGFYHGGLNYEERTAAQEAWISGEIRIMVATNAFGMGIDKRDVRLVVHWYVPESLEGYYQEAGRAGRDGLPANAILLYSAPDIDTSLKQLERSFPSVEEVQLHYQQLANFYQVRQGEGAGSSFPFDINKYCSRYSASVSVTYACCKILELEGFIRLNESAYSPSVAKVLLKNDAALSFIEENKEFGPLLESLLRSYGGLFDHFIRINEDQVGRILQTPSKQVVRMLKTMKKMRVIAYKQRSTEPLIEFTRPRVDANTIRLSKERYYKRKEIRTEKLEAILSYLRNDDTCRSHLINVYFGEEGRERCGVCDTCIETLEERIQGLPLDQQILNALEDRSRTIHELCKVLPVEDQQLIEKVRWMMEEGTLTSNDKDQLIISR